MQRWLARLSFSFFIFAVVLAWDGYRGVREPERGMPQWRVFVQFGAAGILVVLGMLGTRARHRLPRTGDR